MATDNLKKLSFFSTHWNPSALLTKIVEVQLEGETNIDLQKIISKDKEPMSLVTPRRALARAFTSLLGRLIILK